ncbi:hypothetical protein [Kibdelosporangium philippinense]|uniref:hypothetical protein n=1 Tax=Kibdelosporangium philippinense TaxID=211113 RepID=UPI0036193D7D
MDIKRHRQSTLRCSGRSQPARTRPTLGYQERTGQAGIVDARIAAADHRVPQVVAPFTTHAARMATANSEYWMTSRGANIMPPFVAPTVRRAPCRHQGQVLHRSRDFRPCPPGQAALTGACLLVGTSGGK